MNRMVFDCETCMTDRLPNGQLDVENGQAYDLGGQVVNDGGIILDKLNLINGDVFYGMPKAMSDAYYKDKFPRYIEEIKCGERQVVDTWKMWKIFNQMCQDYHVEEVVAHNIRFDIAVLNATMRYQTKSKKRFFLPYGIKTADTMKMARKVICKTKDYIKFCEENNYMTAHENPRPKATAEVIWRYLSNNNNFEEAHTGLADVEIETEILMECLRRGYTELE